MKCRYCQEEIEQGQSIVLTATDGDQFSHRECQDKQYMESRLE